MHYCRTAKRRSIDNTWFFIMHFTVLSGLALDYLGKLEEQQVWAAGQRIGNILSRLTCILLVLAEAHIYDIHFYMT